MKTAEEIKSNLEDKNSDCEKVIASLQAKESEALKDKLNIIQKLRQENDNVVKELEASESIKKIVNKLVKSKDKEIHDLKKENAIVAEDILRVKSEFSEYKSSANKERKEMSKKIAKLEKKDSNENPKNSLKTTSFSCEICDVEAKSVSALKSHIRNHHAQSKCTQTEVLIMLDQKVQCSKLVISSDKMIQTLDDSHQSDADIKLKPFNCFYCEKNITSEQTLSEHKVKCIGVTRIFLFNQSAKRDNLDNVTQPMSPVSLPMFTKSFPFPNSNPRLSHLPECVHCGLKPSCGKDMVNHMKLVHNDHRNPFEVYKKW